MTREREILQISLGSPACQVTAHLLNLQGLAATADHDSGEAPYCQVAVTHCVSEQLRVPRALLIDAPMQTRRPTTEAPTADDISLRHTSAAWFGKVEPLSIHALAEASPTTVMKKDAPLNDWWQNFHNTSLLLAHSDFSRYRVSPSIPVNVAPVYTASSANSRHVDWDDLGDEEEEEEEETEAERRQRLERQHRQWQRGTLSPLQSQLEHQWDMMFQESPTEQPKHEGCPPTSFRPDDLLWTDYLAPPLHPRSILSVPTMHAEAYFPIASGKSMSPWIEDEIFERIRTMLEDCDSCQGSVISTSGFGSFSGVSTQILHYLHDECPSASRIVLSYDNVKKSGEASNELKKEKTLTKLEDTSENWRSHYIESTRESVSRAMAWYDFIESSHAILPLTLPVDSYPSNFHASAATATALEAATLPFRVRPNGNLRIGTNSYYYGTFSGESAFGTVPNLSLAEFLGVVKPRDRLSMLELDALPGTYSDEMRQSLVEGTSIERDRRMRESPHLIGTHRPRDALPGRWLLSPSEGGHLTSFSFQEPTSRTLHTHFALASALRLSKADNVSLTGYVDAVMQGMGIRYRPEQAVSTILNQSIATVTNTGYGAGSYWKSVWGDRPVLSVVGNTTRIYPTLHNAATNLKTALSPRSRGFYNRDVANGILPEMEDCQECLSSLWDLRDLYHPPEGSGLGMEEPDIDL